MNKERYSGVMMTRDGAQYGIVSLSRLLNVALAVFDDSSFYAISTLTLQNTPYLNAEASLGRVADGHANKARSLFLEGMAEKLLPELAAYVRNLPRQNRSPDLDSADSFDARQAMAELRNGLTIALTFKDHYRACVALERNVQRLEADQSILPIMKGFIAEANATYKPEPFLKKVAARMEEDRVRESPMIAGIVARMKAGEAQSASAFTR